MSFEIHVTTFTTASLSLEMRKFSLTKNDLLEQER